MAWLVVVPHGAGAAWRGDRLREPGVAPRSASPYACAATRRLIRCRPHRRRGRSAPGTACSQAAVVLDTRRDVLPSGPIHLGLPMVHLVDDEPVVRDALAWLLRSRWLVLRGFAHGRCVRSLAFGGKDVAGAGLIRPAARCWTSDAGTSGLLLERLDRTRPDRAHAGDLPSPATAMCPMAVAAVKRWPRLRRSCSPTINALVDRGRAGAGSQCRRDSGCARPGGARRRRCPNFTERASARGDGAAVGAWPTSRSPDQLDISACARSKCTAPGVRQDERAGRRAPTRAALRAERARPEAGRSGPQCPHGPGRIRT